MTGQTSYPQDLVGTVVDEVERPLLARCWRAGESVEADTARDRREGARPGAVHPRPARRPADRAPDPGVVDDVRPAHRRARAHLPRDVPAVRADDRRRVVSLRPRRDRDRERAPRRRRRDPDRRRDAGEVREPERGEPAAPASASTRTRSAAYLADIGFDDDAARDAMRRHLPSPTEIERDDVSMFLRVLPLFEDGEPTGALFLMRDVSPTSGAGTGCCCRRTRRSARSITG